MQRLSESPQEGNRSLTEEQLRQATMHSLNTQIQATGIIAIPLGVIAAAFGQLPLAIGAGAISVVTLSLAALQRKVAQKKLDANRK